MNTRLVSVENDNLHVKATKPEKPARPRWLDRLARRLVLARFELIETGQVVVSDNGEHRTFGRLSSEFPLTGQLQVNDPRFYSDVAFGGSIGAGEAYMKGYWDSSELCDLLRILIRNSDMLKKVFIFPAPATSEASSSDGSSCR